MNVCLTYSFFVFFLAAACTGEQQSKFFVLVQPLSLQLPLPSCMCVGKSASVHAEMTAAYDHAQMTRGVHTSRQMHLWNTLMAALFWPSGRETLNSLGLVIRHLREVDIVRKEINTKSKDYEDLIMRTLLQKGNHNLIKLSAAEAFDPKSKLSC